MEPCAAARRSRPHPPMAERHAHRRWPVRERRVGQAGGRGEVRIDSVVRYVPKRGDRRAGSRRAGGVPQHQDPQTRRERPVMAASFDPAETTADVIIVGSGAAGGMAAYRSEEHTSELQSLMRISYAVFCLKKKNHNTTHSYTPRLPSTTIQHKPETQ